MAILFVDFDGTLCKDYFWRSLPTETRSKIQNFLFDSNSDIVADWMLGKYSSEEVNKLLAEHLNYDHRVLWQIFVTDCEHMVVPPVLLELLQSLRAHYTTVLITDNMDCFNRFTVPALQLGKHFDAICNSWNEGRCKRDENGASFAAYSLQNGSSLSDSILIDDSSANCQLFESLGGTAYNVASLEQTQVVLMQLKTGGSL